MSRSRFLILPAAVALLVGVQACDPGDNTVHEHPDNVRHGGGAGAKAGGSGGSLTAAGASGGSGALGGRAGAGGASGVGGAGGGPGGAAGVAGFSGSGGASAGSAGTARAGGSGGCTAGGSGGSTAGAGGAGGAGGNPGTSGSAGAGAGGSAGGSGNAGASGAPATGGSGGSGGSGAFGAAGQGNGGGTTQSPYQVACTKLEADLVACGMDPQKAQLQGSACRSQEACANKLYIAGAPEAVLGCFKKTCAVPAVLPSTDACVNAAATSDSTFVRNTFKAKLNDKVKQCEADGFAKQAAALQQMGEAHPFFSVGAASAATSCLSQSCGTVANCIKSGLSTACGADGWIWPTDAAITNVVTPP